MRKSKNNWARRNFLKRTAIGATGVLLSPTILKSALSQSNISNTIHVGHIGVGARGGNELRNYFLPLPGSRSVGICDVWQERQIKGMEMVSEYYQQNGVNAPKCSTFLDFEEMLERDDIDAVHITTPDHWHVPAAIKAARAGKHIMLAKPLGLSYPHYKILEQELVSNGVRFHYATQQRSMKHMQLGIDMIRNGKIGKIERVDIWSPGKNNVQSPICKEVAVTEGFDYDKWCGPGPVKPFCPERVTNNSSWFQYDYSIGFLAGWGAHPLDILVWGLKEKVSGKYSCEGVGTFWPKGGIYDNIISWDLNYQYKSGINLHFFSNDRASNGLLDYRSTKESNGTTFFGSKGWISLSRSSAESNIPEINTKLNDFPRRKNGRIKGEENTMGQMFLDIIAGKTRETCPLDDAIISDTISHMGDIAIRTKRKVFWNPRKGKLKGGAETNSLYVRKMRDLYAV